MNCHDMSRCFNFCVVSGMPRSVKSVKRSRAKATFRNKKNAAKREKQKLKKKIGKPGVGYVHCRECNCLAMFFTTFGTRKSPCGRICAVPAWCSTPTR